MMFFKKRNDLRLETEYGALVLEGCTRKEALDSIKVSRPYITVPYRAVWGGEVLYGNYNLKSADHKPVGEA